MNFQITKFANERNCYDTTTEFDNEWEPNEHVKSPNFQLDGNSVIKQPKSNKLGSEWGLSTYVKSRYIQRDGEEILEMG